MPTANTPVIPPMVTSDAPNSTQLTTKSFVRGPDAHGWFWGTGLDDRRGSLDVRVSTNGGGFTGQAGAIILGLGRALVSYDGNLFPILREAGALTRDDRKVERKKYGQAGARRRFQFSKR
jgi:hypothetical protein